MGHVRDAYLFVSQWTGTFNGVALIAFAGVGSWLLMLFGPEYATQTTYVVLVILSTLYFFGTWVGPTGALLQMTNGHRVELVNTIIFIVSNIGLNYLLIPAYGIIGAALATFGSGLMRNIIQLAEIGWFHSVSPLQPRNLAVLLLTVLMTAGGFFAGDPWIRLPITVIGMGVVAGLALYTATKNERRAVLDLVLRRREA